MQPQDRESEYEAKEEAREAAIIAELRKIIPDYDQLFTGGRRPALNIIHEAIRKELGLELSEGTKTFGVSGSFRKLTEIPATAWEEWVKWEKRLPKEHSNPTFWVAEKGKRRIWVAEVSCPHPRIPNMAFYADHLLHASEIPQQDDSEET